MLIHDKRSRQEALIHDLRERLKELTAIREVSRIALDPDAGIEATLGLIVDLLPAAWQFPESAVARIQYGDITLASPGFLRTPWLLENTFVTETGGPVTVEVAYLSQQPPADVGAFTSEEVSLIQTIADIAHSYIDRRNTEAEVKQLAGRFSRLFHESVVAMSIVRFRDQRMTDCNDAYLAILGYTREEAVGADMSVLNIWAFPEERQAFARDLLDHGSVEGRETTLVTKAGEQRIVFGSAQTVEVDGEYAVIASFYDVTSPRKAQRDLHDAEKRWNSLFAASGDPVWVIGVDGVIQATSPSVQTALGFSEEESVGQSAFAFIHPDDVSLVQSELAKMAVGGTGFGRAEFRCRHKDGSWRTLEAMATVLSDEAGKMSGLVLMARDVTEEREMQSQILFQAHLLDSVGQAVIATDADGLVTYTNHCAEELFGWKREEMVGRHVAETVKIGADVKAAQTIVATLNAHEKWRGDITLRRGDGSAFDADVTVSPVFDESGVFVGTLGVASDVSARKRAEERLTFLAYHDALTSLPNRLLLQDRLEIALAHARRNDETLGIISLNIDRFQMANDALGADGADSLLVAATSRLSSLVREGDTVARTGGDEFTILAEFSDPADAADTAQRIVDGFRAPFAVGDVAYHATASVGMACYPADGEDARTLSRNADAAKHAAREAGRDCFRPYRPEMPSHGADWLALQTNLRDAVTENEIEVYFQPQVRVDTGEVVGVEALARWHHRTLGFIPPMDFIPLAEESSLIIALGDQVLRRACMEAATWPDRGVPAVRVAVNVSLMQFHNPGFADAVRRVIEETGLPPERLDLEITESTALKDVPTTVGVARQLTDMGIRLSIDDFGTGNTSLRHLNSFPIKALKIDQTFIRDILTNPYNAAIATSVIALGHQLGFSVIAEGVETEGQLEFLRRHNCDEYQGYLCSRPVPPDQIREILKANASRHAIAAT